MGRPLLLGSHNEDDLPSMSNKMILKVLWTHILVLSDDGIVREVYLVDILVPMAKDCERTGSKINGVKEKR